jgi:hypothetical protein
MTPEEKQALAREAQSVLNNMAFQRAVKAIEHGAIEEMLGAQDDTKRRLAADHVKVVRGIVQLLEMAIIDSKQSVRPKAVV